MAKLIGVDLLALPAPGTGSADTAFSVRTADGSGSLLRISGDGATTISGSLTVTGSLTAGSFTGSITGTASYATQALSASFANTASYVNPLVQNVQLTGSLNVTQGITGSLLGTSSYASQALSASFATSTAAVAGTTNYIPKFSTSTTLGNSVIFETGSNIGIGTTSLGDNKVNIYSTLSNTLDRTSALNVTYQPTFTATTAYRWGIQGNLFISNQGTISGFGSAGVLGRIQFTGTNTYSYSTGHEWSGVKSEVFMAAGSTANRLAGVYIAGQTSGGVIGDFYRLLIQDVTVGTITNDYGIYQVSGVKNYFAGNIGIGTTSPTAKLHVVAPGALSTDLAFRIRNSANTADLFSVQGNGITNVSTLTASNVINIAQGAGLYYPTLSFSNNGGVGQGSIFGYNNRLCLSSSRIIPGNVLSVNFGYFDGNYAQLEVLAKSALSTDNAFGVLNSLYTGYHLKVTNAGNVQTGVGGLSIPRTDTPNGTLLGTLTYRTDGFIGFDKPILTSKVASGTSTLSYIQLDDFLHTYQVTGAWSGAPNAFVFQSNGAQGLASNSNNFFTVANGSNNLFTIKVNGDVGIGKTTPNAKLDVSGSARISGAGNTSISSSLVVYGSGSAQPVFTVQGSQGELFSVTDSLSGSLFSVNDISGLPIMEVFSDNTTLMGSYQDPMLITTAKVTQTNSGSFTVYSLPTASYDTAFFEYSIRSGSNARAGTIMAMQLGSTVNFTETTTTDFGDTSAVSFTVVVTGSNMALTGSSTSGAWTIKTIVRGI